MMLAPEISGTVAIHASPDRFIQAFRDRVEAGLLGRPSARSNYRMIASNEGEIRIGADDWLTAINVGLNDVSLRFPRPGVLAYDVRYWRWAFYVLGLSGLLGLTGSALALMADARGYIARNASARFPGMSVDQNLLFLWAFILFWGFVWPWLLIAMHKGPLRRLLIRLIGEADSEAMKR